MTGHLFDTQALADRLAVVGTIGSGTFTVGASIMHNLNEYLQAGAFVVAIVSGLAATFYYIRRSGDDD